MAYRFQDLQGNWRIRYDDGTTSAPFDANEISPSERTSVTEFQDTNNALRNKFGVDDGFATSSAALGGAMQANGQTLREAVIDNAMSSSRIATFQSEFQPLAEMSQTQDTLISKVAANPAADPEMRAGAFQALYPGMKVSVTDNGNLSFTAKATDLGFSYPNKQIAAEKALKAKNPNASISYGERLDELTTLIGQMQQATTPEQVNNIQAQAAAIQASILEDKKSAYQIELSATLPIARLEESLKKARLLDEQQRIFWEGRGQYYGGDSKPTLEIVQQLAFARSELDRETQDKLLYDPEVVKMRSAAEVITAAGSHFLQEALTASTLVNPSSYSTVMSVWNEDGSAATPAQSAEFQKRLAAGDASAILLSEFTNYEAVEAIMKMPSLNKIDQKVATRIFDTMAGQEGLYAQLSGDVENFEGFLSTHRIQLSAEETEILKAIEGVAFANRDAETQERMIAQAMQLKLDKVINVYREARDRKVTQDVVRSSAVPPDTEIAQLWKEANESLSSAEHRSILASLSTSYLGGKKEELEAKMRIEKFEADPASYYTYTLEDVLRKMGELVAGRGRFSVNRRDYLSYEDSIAEAKKVSDVMASWLAPQMAAAPASNVLGKVAGMGEDEIRNRILFHAFKVREQDGVVTAR